MLSLNSSTVDAEIAKSKEFYQSQLQRKKFPEKLEALDALDAKNNKNHTVFKWLLGLLAVISTFFWWKKRKK
ncbi:MAG: hypothetical protein H6665_16255 [Ardenticatenaceae bacterium]|nr:hypothetical protein [Ardenticatenaceae bacterium]